MIPVIVAEFQLIYHGGRRPRGVAGSPLKSSTDGGEPQLKGLSSSWCRCGYRGHEHRDAGRFWGQRPVSIAMEADQSSFLLSRSAMCTVAVTLLEYVTPARSCLRSSDL